MKPHRSISKRTSRRRRAAKGRLAVPLIRQIGNRLNRSDPFVAAEFREFQREQAELLSSLPFGSEGLPIRSQAAKAAVVEVRRRQVLLAAMKKKHRLSEAVAEADLRRAEGIMMATVDAYETKPGGSGFTVNLTRLRLEPKRWTELDQALDFAARLANGTATPEQLEKVRVGELPANVPGKIAVGEEGMDLQRWFSDLAELLQEGGEQAEHAVSQVLSQRGACMKALEAEGTPPPLRFLSKLVLASGRLTKSNG